MAAIFLAPYVATGALRTKPLITIWVYMCIIKLQQGDREERNLIVLSAIQPNPLNIKVKYYLRGVRGKVLHAMSMEHFPPQTV